MDRNKPSAPTGRRGVPPARLTDGELELELTLTVAARTAVRKQQFDALYAERERRRAVAR